MAKDAQQSARGKLRAAPEYADARTALAQEQAKRIKQIRLKAERELIPADEVHRFLVSAGAGFNVRLRSIEKRLRASYPGLDAEVYSFVKDAHEDALGLLSE